MFQPARCLSTIVRRTITQSCHKRAHLTGIVAVKKFADSENDYASAVLRNVAQKRSLEIPVTAHKVPADLENILQTHVAWCNAHPERVLLLLRHIVASAGHTDNGASPLEDVRFTEFITTFVKLVPTFTDTQLSQALETLAALEEIKSIYEPNYLLLWTTLDSECLERVANWNVEQLLHFADQWYPLRLAKQGKYVNKAIWKISNRLRKLPPEQLLKTVFYINLTRVPVENMMDIETNFHQNFDAFSIDNIAVLCMGFFKTETPIRNSELLEKIYHQLTMQVSSVEDIALTAILKLLRYSSRIPNVSSMERLLDALVPEIPRLSLLACLHVALLGSDIHVCHRDTLALIVDKFLQNINNLRLKDVERIAFVLAHGNIALKDNREMLLLRTILADIPNRVAEIVQYPKCYISLLHFLSLRNIYDTAYISGAFERRFLQLAYSKNIGGAGREAVALDAFVAINLAEGEYGGNRFPDNAFRLVCKLTQDYLPNPSYKLTKSDRMLLDIQTTFSTIWKAPCQILHLLPHYQRPDILFCFDDRTRKVVTLSETFEDGLPNTHAIMKRENVLGERRSCDSNLRLVAIVVGSWNCYVRNDRRRTGGYEMKLAQLRKLNYETIEIPWYEWPVYSRDDMRKYLEAKLSPFLAKARRMEMMK
uniref:RAP domain-containing protein n=1 Tax=Anopheles culicifacies TaxID=139723 RepID=A0A182MK28_9DIPT